MKQFLFFISLLSFTTLANASGACVFTELGTAACQEAIQKNYCVNTQDGVFYDNKTCSVVNSVSSATGTAMCIRTNSIVFYADHTDANEDYCLSIEGWSYHYLPQPGTGMAAFLELPLTTNSINPLLAVSSDQITSFSVKATIQNGNYLHCARIVSILSPTVGMSGITSQRTYTSEITPRPDTAEECLDQNKEWWQARLTNFQDYVENTYTDSTGNMYSFFVNQNAASTLTPKYITGWCYMYLGTVSGYYHAIPEIANQQTCDDYMYSWFQVHFSTTVIPN